MTLDGEKNADFEYIIVYTGCGNLLFNIYVL